MEQRISLYIRQQQYPENCTDLEKRNIRKQAANFIVKDNLLYRKSKDGIRRVISTPEEQMRIIHDLHEMAVGGGHFGINATYYKVRERYWWNKLRLDVESYCRKCVPCNKVSNIFKF